MRNYGKNDLAIHARAGERFTVELESMPTAGYGWTLSKTDSSIHLISQDTRAQSTGIGGAAVDVFLLEPSSPGNWDLEWRYGRPWEAKATQRHVVRVEVES